MLQTYYLIFLSLLIKDSFCNYHGPFLLWGHNNLEHENLPALEAMNERSLTLMYSEAKAIILFVRNGTSKLNKENFPNFSSMISQNRWVYLPQEHLPAEPVDFNSNVEVITLVGPASQQDIELGALYRDAVSTYGEGKVLGILSTQAEENHYIYKRDVSGDEGEEEEEEGEEKEEKENKDEEKGKTEIESANLENKKGKEKNEKKGREEEIEEETEEIEKMDHVYLAKKNKSLLYTTVDPIFTWEFNDKPEVFNLSQHGDVTSDERKEYVRLIIHFKLDNNKLYVRIRFPLSGGYWSISEAEVEYRETKVVLPLISKSPSAPIGFSYKCAHNELVFQNGSTSLVIKDYQVEPVLKEGVGKFSDAYDCVDFTTVPIWSGIFVTALITGVTFIGILALMDIKTPNRFESSRSKQLTFTVQE
ncbi:uncharacterized protein LOC129614516 [Condylostylus longicornis]|uniref:uncharacterized protein LOC129614516 n=1 Tax=Condylostylus longicornis TaxID=2530218 RepID=UPI00244D9ECA|nr:uncharacterized protein LOC129614516 [Condylostylus longicornis]